MLSVLAASLILGITLTAFFVATFVPIRFRMNKLLDTPDDNFISSRNTQSWVSIGLSLYAGAVGTWALTAPVESSITGGWWALIGYAVGCGFPWLMFLWSGKELRHCMGDRGFTSLEFVYERYGRPMHIIVASMSIIYLLAMLTAELTAIGKCFTALSPDFPPLAVTLSVAIVTNCYSALGGFPASMVTDKFQAIVTLLLIAICYAGVFGYGGNHIDSSSWSKANIWPTEGVATAFILVFSCFVVEQINQTTWQRVFAARTDRDMRWGFMFGIVLMFPSMMLFGFVGIVGAAANYSEYIKLDPNEPGLALFLLVAKLPEFCLGLVACLGVCLVTSTADTIQTGLSAVIAGELSNRKMSLTWARVFSLLLNIPPILFATLKPPSILYVLIATNVITVAIVPPVLLGALPYTTPIGAVCGVIAGLISIPIQGWIFTHSARDAFLWSTFPHGFNWECFATFVVVSLTSAAVTLIVAQIEFFFNSVKLHEQEESLTRIRSPPKAGSLVS